MRSSVAPAMRVLVLESFTPGDSGVRGSRRFSSSGSGWKLNSGDKVYEEEASKGPAGSFFECLLVHGSLSSKLPQKGRAVRSFHQYAMIDLDCTVASND